MLFILAGLQRKPNSPILRGSWNSAVFLFLYAITFSFAYLSLSTGTGALILFGSVQVTMIVVALRERGTSKSVGMDWVVPCSGRPGLFSFPRTDGSFTAWFCVDDHCGNRMGLLHSAWTRVAKSARKYGREFCVFGSDDIGCSILIVEKYSYLFKWDFVCNHIRRDNFGCGVCDLVCGITWTDHHARGNNSTVCTGYCGLERCCCPGGECVTAVVYRRSSCFGRYCTGAFEPCKKDIGKDILFVTESGLAAEEACVPFQFRQVPSAS